MRDKRDKRHLLIMDLMKNRVEWKMAELGVLKGRLTKKMLENCSALTEYWGIDIWKPSNYRTYKAKRMPQEKWDELYLSCCKLMFVFPGKLNLIKMSSVVASQIFPKEYFDLVFIDDDHSYEYVLKAIKAYIPIVKTGGFITGHDYGTKRGVTEAVDESFDTVDLIGSSVWVKRI